MERKEAAMATVILPEELTRKLQVKADDHQQSLDQLVVDLLTTVLEEENDPWPSLEEIVAKIKATPSDPSSIHPATESLADLLRQGPEPDPNFDAAEWDRQWAAIEAEMDAMNRADDIAEGRA